MISSPAFVAVDWGTSSLRLWSLGCDDKVQAKASGPFGMSGLHAGDYPHVLQEHLTQMAIGDEVPVVISGMAGAAQGWIEAPYLPIEVELSHLQRAVVPVPGQGRDVWIVPGFKQSNPTNVMRGEETQILGLLALKPGFEGVVALPGTHTKWVRVRNGRIMEFVTCMTGELFNLLSEQSVLRHSMTQDGWDKAAFHDAVEQAYQYPQSVVTSLFNIRSDMLLSDMKSATARAQLSGLLIGLELSATRCYWQANSVSLIGAPDLCGNYSGALRSLSAKAEIFDAQALTLEGLKQVFSVVKES